MNTEPSNSTCSRSKVSLLPKDNIQSKYQFRLRLGFIPQRKKKTIKVMYSEYHGILQVGFEKPDGSRFLGQYSAEKWFGGPIEVSPHVGRHVMNSVHEAHVHTACKKCGIGHRIDNIGFVITDDMLSNGPLLQTSFEEECPTCNGIRHVEIKET